MKYKIGDIVEMKDSHKIRSMIWMIVAIWITRYK